ncbi:hypothetical protein RUM44_010160 [Polyplax serrata]|uniref:Uncharacterized protein n=1 Tax=Polyplax serrata TaxID=468196 RepID=A0ABR1AVD5_POLSC
MTDGHLLKWNELLRLFYSDDDGMDVHEYDVTRSLHEESFTPQISPRLGIGNTLDVGVDIFTGEKVQLIEYCCKLGSSGTARIRYLIDSAGG